MARSMSRPSASSSRPSSRMTRARERSALFTSKLGFSVVAPRRVTTPLSTSGSTASCCALLKRWISSMKSTVRWPMRRRSRARSMILRSSATPDDTALTDSKAAPDISARMLASDVLPLPGGPQRMSEGMVSPSSARRSTVPGPTARSWPANSSSVRGRIRAASGVVDRAAAAPASPAGAAASAAGGAPPKRSGWGSVIRTAYAAGRAAHGGARAAPSAYRWGGAISPTRRREPRDA